jgi:hypothetical protein
VAHDYSFTALAEAGQGIGDVVSPTVSVALGRDTVRHPLMYRRARSRKSSKIPRLNALDVGIHSSRAMMVSSVGTTRVPKIISARRDDAGSLGSPRKLLHNAATPRLLTPLLATKTAAAHKVSAATNIPPAGVVSPMMASTHLVNETTTAGRTGVIKLAYIRIPVMTRDQRVKVSG